MHRQTHADLKPHTQSSLQVSGRNAELHFRDEGANAFAQAIERARGRKELAHG